MPIREPKPERDEPWPPGRCAKLETREQSAEWVNLSTLSEADRRKAWKQIQQNKPETADLITDPFVQEMRAIFGAEICVPSDELRDNDA